MLGRREKFCKSRACMGGAWKQGGYFALIGVFMADFFLLDCVSQHRCLCRICMLAFLLVALLDDEEVDIFFAQDTCKRDCEEPEVDLLRANNDSEWLRLILIASVMR